MFFKDFIPEYYQKTQKIIELRKRINNKRNEIKILEDELNALNNIKDKLDLDNNDINKVKENDKIISVLFMTQGNQDIINYSMACKSTDLFSSLEERLYQDFPKYRTFKKIFMVRANRILRNKTLEQNNIKNNDIICLFPID